MKTGDFGWSRVDDLVNILHKRWAKGVYARNYMNDIAWQPITLPIRGPKAPDLLEHFDAVKAWLEKFERDCARRGFTLEYRTLRTRSVGENRIPRYAIVETEEHLHALLGVNDQVQALHAVLDETHSRTPALVDWVRMHPMRAVELHDVWSRLLSTVIWIADRATKQLYVRHIDAVGVDTKFVEQYKYVLGQLLDVVLPKDRVHIACTHNDFAGRYGFMQKPSYTRLRYLSHDSALRSGMPEGITEVVLRSDELARMVPSAKTVYVIENEVTYLALPEIADAIAVFGEGFALAHLHKLGWLHEKQIIYWGDIDTHGFVMLDRMREHFGAAVCSVMMDARTLLDHAQHWGTEPQPVSRVLPNLSDEETDLYRDIVEDRYGHHVRLEQERIRFGYALHALHALHALPEN